MSHLVYQCASFFIRAFYQTKYSSRLLIDPELMVSHAVFILNRPVGDMGCFDILNRNIFNLVEIQKEWHMYKGIFPAPIYSCLQPKSAAKKILHTLRCFYYHLI